MEKKKVLFYAWKSIAKELTEKRAELKKLKEIVSSDRKELNTYLSFSHGFEDKIEHVRRQKLYPSLNRYRNLKAKVKELNLVCRELKSSYKHEIFGAN